MSPVSQNPKPLSSTSAFVDLVAAINPSVPSDRVVDLLANFRTAVRDEHRAEVLREAAGMAEDFASGPIEGIALGAFAAHLRQTAKGGAR